MIRLQDKPNVIAPDSDYPYGRIRNKSGIVHGTPVSQQVYGDMHQFFSRLMAIAGVVANGLPDNAYSGFQLIIALQTVITGIVNTAVAAEAVIRSAADVTLQNNINSEASSRSSADTTLQTNINNEATTRSSADTTLTTNKANRAQSAWAAIPLTGSWPTHSGAYHGAEFRIDEFGKVNLRGVLDQGVATGSNLLAGGWMSGASVINKVSVLVDDNAGNITINSIDIQPNGSAAFAKPVLIGQTISLDGVSFWID